MLILLLEFDLEDKVFQILTRSKIVLLKYMLVTDVT